MHEKKNPNRPLIVYYIIALVVVMLLNALLFPQIERYSVKQVDYSEFLSMLEDGKVKSVEINDTQIAFTPVEQIQDGKATYYTTNRVTADDKLVERLLAARIDVEVKQIIANCYEQAYQILSDNKEKLHETAKVLLEKETITGMEFMAILAPNQLPSAETEKAEEKPEEKPDDSADDVEVK